MSLDNSDKQLVKKGNIFHILMYRKLYKTFRGCLNLWRKSLVCLAILTFHIVACQLIIIILASYRVAS